MGKILGWYGSTFFLTAVAFNICVIETRILWHLRCWTRKKSECESEKDGESVCAFTRVCNRVRKCVCVRVTKKVKEWMCLCFVCVSVCEIEWESVCAYVWACVCEDCEQERVRECARLCLSMWKWELKAFPSLHLFCRIKLILGMIKTIRNVLQMLRPNNFGNTQQNTTQHRHYKCVLGLYRRRKGIYFDGCTKENAFARILDPFIAACPHI